MATLDKKKLEEAVLGVMSKDIKKESNRLKDFWINLTKYLEYGIRDSFKRCSGYYVKRLNNHIKDLKKEYDVQKKALIEKHKELEKKQPKIKDFSLKNLEKKEKILINEIHTLISFSVWFPKFYREKFEAAFNSPEHFFKFFSNSINCDIP